MKNDISGIEETGLQGFLFLPEPGQDISDEILVAIRDETLIIQGMTHKILTAGDLTSGTEIILNGFDLRTREGGFLVRL